MGKRAGLGIAVVVLLLIAILIVRYDDYKPAVLSGAHIQLPFENDLANIGSEIVDGEFRQGKLRFEKSVTGQSFFALGDGSWMEYQASGKQEFAEAVEISFDFKPEQWENPYKQGSAVKTIAVVSGRSNEKIRHIAFSISSGNQPSVSVSLENQFGNRTRLHSEAGSISWGWHSVRLRIDRSIQKTSLYLDDAMISSTDVMPAPIELGFNRIVLGTWYKRNQAYRGLIDNFIIRDLDGAE